MTVRETLAGLAGRTEREVLALWDRQRVGTITRYQFVLLAAAVIARANHRAVTVADTALALQLSRMLRKPVAPLGLVTLDDQGRLRKAVGTVLTADVDLGGEALVASQAARLGRLARAEPLDAGQDAIQTAMQNHKVKGWVRVTDANACPICEEWADGVERPASVRMARHTVCGCAQQPVL